MISSVYIHIPFCNHICSYCNFPKFFYDEKRAELYLEALEKEIQKRYQGEEIKTLYIGGGTPSSLSIRLLEKLFQVLEIFNLKNLEEFTIECNPESLTEEKIQLFKKKKVNRISLGVESTLKKNLAYLGRHHDFLLVKEKIKLLKKYGFNINVDLIYALPREAIKDLERELLNILQLDVNHISTYSLMIEEHTKLSILKAKPINEDLDFKMYQLICKKLKEKGYVHYEISNFAKKGFESKHNLTYWHNNYYYGFGLGAASYIPAQRFTNTISLTKYLSCNYVKEIENLTSKDTLSYALILGFRLIKGLNQEEFFNKYHVPLIELYNIKDLLKEGKLVEEAGNIMVSYDKIYIENDILINFVGE